MSYKSNVKYLKMRIDIAFCFWELRWKKFVIPCHSSQGIKLGITIKPHYFSKENNRLNLRFDRKMINEW